MEVGNKKTVDSIGKGANETSVPEKKPTSQEVSSETIRLKMTDNKIPHRGIWWYVFFTLIFLISTTLIIYLSDWPLLFFVVIFAGVTLWRGHTGSTMTLEIRDETIKVNEKQFSFDQIDSWYFSNVGEDFTITFQMAKKYLPRLTFIFSNSKYSEQIRAKLNDKIPETEPKEESFVDFFIRKLKI